MPLPTGSKFTPSVTASELWDARLVASYTVNQLAEQQYRLDQLVHCPSALPPLGAWAHVTDLSGTEDTEVDPMHMDPLQAAAPSQPPPAPCVLPHPDHDPMTSHCKNGGDLASCLGGGRHVQHLHQQQQQQQQQQRQQGCFQLRSGRYGRRDGPGGSSTAAAQQPQPQQQQQGTGKESAAQPLDIPDEHVPKWMRAHLEKSAGASDEGRWHPTTQRRFAQLGHRWKVVNSWRGVKFKGTDLLRQKLACTAASKHGCQAMAMVYRREHRNAATEESEDPEEPSDKELGEEEPMLVRFAGTHNHLRQQSDIHSTQRQMANDLMQDHLPLALLDQLRGAAPSCTLHPHQHPVVPPAFHQLPFSQQQQQQQPLFPAAIPPAQNPRSSTAVSGAVARSTATNSGPGDGAAVGGAAESSTPECRAVASSAAVSRYSLRGMEGLCGQQLGLAACPDALAGKVPSAHPIAAFASNEVTAPLIAHVEAALKKCDPCTTTVMQLWQLLLRPVVRPSLPRPPSIERVREALLCLAHRQEVLSLAVQHTQTQHGGCAGVAGIAQEQQQQQLQQAGGKPLPLANRCTDLQVHPDHVVPAHTEAQLQQALPQSQLQSQQHPESRPPVLALTQEQGQGHDRLRGPAEQQHTLTQQQWQHGPTQQQQQQCVALPAARLEGALRRWLEQQQQQQQQQQQVPAPGSLAGAEGVLGTSAACAATHALELLRSVLSSRSACSISRCSNDVTGTRTVRRNGNKNRLPALLKSFAQGRQQQQLQHSLHGFQDREEDRQQATHLESLQQAESFMSSLVQAEGGPDSTSGRAYWMPPPPTPGSNMHPWSMARLLPVVGLMASDPLAPWGADAHTHAPPPLPHNAQEQQQQPQDQAQALQQKGGKGPQSQHRKRGRAVLEEGQQEQQGEGQQQQPQGVGEQEEEQRQQQQQQQPQGEQQHEDEQQEGEQQKQGLGAAQGETAEQGKTAEQKQRQLEEQEQRHQVTKQKQQEYAGKLRLGLAQAGYSPSVIAEWTAVALCWSVKARGRAAWKWPARYVHPQHGTFKSISGALQALRRTQQQQQGGHGADAAGEAQPQEGEQHSSKPRQQGQPPKSRWGKTLQKKVQEALQWQKEAEEESAQQWQKAQAQRLAREPSGSKHVGLLKPQALRGNAHMAPPIVLLPPPNSGYASYSSIEGLQSTRLTALAHHHPRPAQPLTGAHDHPSGEGPEGVQGPGSRPVFQPNSVWKRPSSSAGTPHVLPSAPGAPQLLLPAAGQLQNAAVGALQLLPAAAQNAGLGARAAAAGASQPLPAVAGASQHSLPATTQLQSAGWGAKVAALGRRARAEVRPSVLQAASARLAAILGRSGNVAGSAGARGGGRRGSAGCGDDDAEAHAGAGDVGVADGAGDGGSAGDGDTGAGRNNGSDSGNGFDGEAGAGVDGICDGGAAARNEQFGDDDIDGGNDEDEDEDEDDGNVDDVREGDRAGMAGHGDASMPASPPARTRQGARATGGRQSIEPQYRKRKADDTRQRQQEVQQQQQQQQQRTAQHGSQLHAETAAPNQKRLKHQHRK